MQLPVLGNAGVPGAGVSAVLVNVTAVNETGGGGYLTLYQTGAAQPATSSLNYRPGVVVANEALVQVGANGTITIANTSSGQTDVLVDVEGWVANGGGTEAGAVTTGPPARLLDTRTSIGGHNGPLAAGQSVQVQAEGAGGIPSSGVTAVFADIIAVPVGTAGGYLTGYRSDAASVPVSADVNFAPGVATSQMSLLPLSSSGAFDIYNNSPGANVVVDVFGWVSGGSLTADGGIEPVPAARILDTRTSIGGRQGRLSAGQTLTVPVLGVGGVPSSGVAAVVAHIAVVDQAASTYLTVFPSGYAKPGTSLLNAGAGTAVSNTIVVPVGPNGDISIYNYSSDPNVVVDIQGWIALPALTVRPPLASALGAGPELTSADGSQARSILDNANLYAMTTWWNNSASSLMTEAAQHVDPSGTDMIRRLSMEAYSLATAISTGAYDPSYAGVPTATAQARTIQLIAAVAGNHLTNSAGGWGASWQSMFWAAYDGAAAWMLWPQLTAQQQAQVARMVYFEANFGAGYRLQFYANAAGTILTPGDTGADTDSWLPMAAQLAVVMMPTNPLVPVWQNTIARDAIAAWARPSDDGSTTAENGATVAAWLNGQGSNVNNAGDLVNHGRPAPDYSTLIYQNMQDILLDSLAGQPVPRAVTALVAPVYAAYTTVTYTDPPWDAPGGTVYTPGSPAIYYPHGDDWGVGQEIPYALVDAESGVFGVGTPTSKDFEAQHAGTELAMQQANSDGETYANSTLYNYQGREEHVAQQAAQLYLTFYIRDHALDSFTDNSLWLAP